MAKKLSLNEIVSALQSIVPMEVSDRTVVDVSKWSASVTLTIGQIFALVKDKKLKRNLMQRNDELRRAMGRAKHVTHALHVAHLDVIVAYYAGEYHLIDGCHRIGHWYESLGASIPSHVTVIVKVPQTEEEYMSLYRAYDSSKAGKTMRDFIYGYMRHLGFAPKLRSTLLKTGSFATAFKNLCKGANGRTELETMRVYRAAILSLDAHNLVPEEIPQGFVQGAILLYHTMNSSAPVKEYVNELITAYTRGVSTVSVPTKSVMKAVGRVREEYGDNISGESPAKDIAVVIENGFDRFCVTRTGNAAKTFARKHTVVPASSLKLV